MYSEKFNTAKSWFEKLRDSLISNIEKVDNGRFIVTKWDHKDIGGGTMSKIKGNVIFINVLTGSLPRLEAALVTL